MGAHVGDIGTIIRYTTQTDLSDATVMKMKYKKPDGTTGEWDGTIYNDYSMDFETTQASDLDQAGPWNIQLYIETPDWKGHSDIKQFEVLPNVA